MSREGSARRWAALLFATAVASLRGTDEAPPATGIAAAKRDYEEVKAATGTGAQLQKLALPKTTSPSLDLRSDLPPTGSAVPSVSTRRQTEKLGEASAKSKNWLLDALNKPAGQRGERTITAKRESVIEGKLDQGESTLRAAQNPPAGDERPSLAENRREASRVRPSDVSNPLDRFMAAWMTPQDFKLLNAAPKGDSVDGATALPLAGTLAPPALSEFTLSADRVDRRAPDTNGVDGPAANPYLAAVEAPLPVIQTLRDSPANRMPTAAETFPRGINGPLPAIAAAAPATKPNSPASDFQKAQDDAKYFKQLKRF